MVCTIFHPRVNTNVRNIVGTKEFDMRRLDDGYKPSKCNTANTTSVSAERGDGIWGRTDVGRILAPKTICGEDWMDEAKSASSAESKDRYE
jgi:hypothetical protein